jgi:plastocyanin
MTVRISAVGLAVGALTVLALFATAACSNDNGSSTPTVSAGVPATSGAGTNSATDGAHSQHTAEIDQRNMAFIPGRVSVKVGETVLIKNSETAIHTANVNGKKITGDMKRGDSTAWTAKQPGE